MTDTDIRIEPIAAAPVNPTCGRLRIARAEQLAADAFPASRSPRSPQYRAGALAALQCAADGEERDNPHALGTSRADAWLAGYAEGHARARRATW